MSKLDLTPVDIRHKEFGSQMLGYNKAEVREFLELISAQMDENKRKKTTKVQEQAPVRSNINTANVVMTPQEPVQQVEKAPEPVNTSKEDLISRTLLLAEQTKTEILDNAKKEAQNIIRDAELKAKKSIEEARHFLNVLEHEYINIKEQKKQFLMHFKSELEVLLERINRDTILNDEKEQGLDKKLKTMKDLKHEMKKKNEVNFGENNVTENPED
jgi:cell division initiation protein